MDVSIYCKMLQKPASNVPSIKRLDLDCSFSHIAGLIKTVLIFSSRSFCKILATEVLHVAYIFGVDSSTTVVASTSTSITEDVPECERSVRMSDTPLLSTVLSRLVTPSRRDILIFLRAF